MIHWCRIKKLFMVFWERKSEDMTNYLMNVLFCVICALMLYELSGFIGKEMLSDKHITGKGKGYCDITFGKENKKSLIVNIQYNIFAPIIYMLLIAALLQYVGMQELRWHSLFRRCLSFPENLFCQL